MMVISVAAIGIFSAYMLYDLKQIPDGGGINYISATLALYLDLFNVFQSLLALLGIMGASATDRQRSSSQERPRLRTGAFLRALNLAPGCRYQAYMPPLNPTYRLARIALLALALPLLGGLRDPQPAQDRAWFKGGPRPGRWRRRRRTLRGWRTTSPLNPKAAKAQVFNGLEGRWTMGTCARTSSRAHALGAHAAGAKPAAAPPNSPEG